MDKNSVIVKGKIVNKYKTRGEHIILTIKTCKHNFPAIFFPKAVSADMADEFEVGDNVEIVGNLQSTKKNNLFTCGIFGTEIRYAEDENRRNYFELEGRIIKFESLGNMYRLIIESEVDNHYSTVPVVFYNKKHEKILLERRVGEMLQIRGVIQTKKADFPNGNRLHYVNFVAYSCA